jgi:hypothetical protein
MAIAYDAASELARTGTSDPMEWTHTPSGIPRAIVVAFVHGTSSTDHVTTVTYGGVSMSEVVRGTDTVTEPGAAELWFLGSGIPTGAQTVSADLSSGTTDDIHGVAISLTANGDTEVLDSDSDLADQANPSVTLSYGGRTCISIGALYGGGAAPSSFTPNGNCTTVHDHDLGAFYSEVIRQTTPGTADFAIGGTSLSDDVAFVACCVSEKQFSALRQTIINGLDSAQAEGTGWNTIVRDAMATSAVVRTSSTVVTVTLPAFASYNITAQETITVTVPKQAISYTSDLTGTPTFTVSVSGGGGGDTNAVLLGGDLFDGPMLLGGRLIQ